ncbi:MAG: permease-like cell division protein FtsX [Steroidobacteraceae bacterium]|nr:permease-like cell division protein FtsX [Steroidobacteraceae bacterium]MDW8260089.1 permease-like cell division protein FtsX [Gammaproteobacteria bacterium]
MIRPAVWLARHAQALLAASGRLARRPLGTLLTVLVIAIALALPLGLKLGVDNLRAATGNFADALDLTVYLKTDVDLQQAQQLARNARSRRDVAAVTLISAEEGLEEFREHSGFGAALDALEGNPLPHVLNVRPAGNATAPAQIEELRRYFAAWPEVELVQVDNDWVRRFSALLDFLRRLLLLLAALFGIGVIAVIGNTIRLDIEHRRAEIEVAKLVGGSNAFVRRPFLYAGALYGLLGAALAIGLLVLTAEVLAEPTARLAQLYGSGFRLIGPDTRDVTVLLVGATVLGILAAGLSAGRHLSSIEPRP